MAYRLYKTAQGDFCIDWDTCCQILKSYHRARAQNVNSKEVTESQGSLLNPLSWGLPDLSYVEVEWAKVRTEADGQTLLDGFRLGAIATYEAQGVDALARELQRMQTETRRLNQEFQGKMKRASEKSWAAIESSVNAYQKIVDGLKFIRDLAGSFLIGAATVTTGGAALAAAGLGTGLKTTAKYQDTGSVGSAALEATQNLAFAVFPAARGKALAGGEKVVKVLVTGGMETGKALLEGRRLTTAVAEGGVSIPNAVVADVVKKVAGPLGKTAVPIVVKILEDQSKKRAQAWVREATATPAGTARTGGDGLADSVSFEDALLIKLAIIDMSKGIGRSWW